MRVEKVKAVKADVLQRYFNLLERFIRANRTHKDNLKASSRRRDIKGMVEYNKLYLKEGINPTVFVEFSEHRKKRKDIK